MTAFYSHQENRGGRVDCITPKPGCRNASTSPLSLFLEGKKGVAVLLLWCEGYHFTSDTGTGK